jgi:prepilin-type processing-associated H-X9-DG protein
MEQQNLFNACNFQLNPQWSWPGGVDNGGGWEVCNFTARTIRVESFLCPSDQRKGNRNNKVFTWGAWDASQQANYCENLGGNRFYYGGQPNGIAYYHGSTPNNSLVANWNEAATRTTLGFAHVADGLSMTAFFSEIVKGDGTDPNSSSDSLGMFYSTTTAANTALPNPNVDIASNEFINSKLCDSSLSRNFSWRGERWICQDIGRGGPYSHTSPPNRKSCYYSDSQGANPFSYEAISTAGSAHPGGVNVLFGDGSVRFIKNSVDYRTWYFIGSRNGGEVISADSL